MYLLQGSSHFVDTLLGQKPIFYSHILRNKRAHCETEGLFSYGDVLDLSLTDPKLYPVPGDTLVSSFVVTLGN